jgi:hypothetical protein
MSGSTPGKLEEIIAHAGRLAAGMGVPRIAVLGANDETVINSAALANSEWGYRLAKFLLVGPHTEISRLAWDYDISVDNDNFTIMDAGDPLAKCMGLCGRGVANMLVAGSVPADRALHEMRSRPDFGGCFSALSLVSDPESGEMFLRAAAVGEGEAPPPGTESLAAGFGVRLETGGLEGLPPSGLVVGGVAPLVLCPPGARARTVVSGICLGIAWLALRAGDVTG